MIASAIALAVWALVLARARRMARETVKIIPRNLADEVGNLANEVGTPALSADPGSVTILVPARDEAEIIEACVRALRGQGVVVAEVIAIDDRSSDGTGAILARLCDEGEAGAPLRVLDGRGPGPGECGKPAALRDALARVAPETEWLLFVDADVVLAPGAVDGLLAAARGQGAALVSVFPALELRGFLEGWIMPSVGAVIAAAYPARKVADPSSPIAFANGQLILVSRAAYQAAGGHGAVVHEILEDVRLAERVKRSGARLLLADGRAIARTRMYASAGELIEGWSKNLYLLLGGRPLPALLWMVLTTLMASLGWIALLLDGLPWGALAFAGVTGVQMLLRARGGTPAIWAVIAPLGALVVDALVVRSAWLRARGRVRWKGRSYGGAE